MPLYGSKDAFKNMGNDTVLLQHWSIEAWHWGFDGNFQRQIDILSFSIQSEEKQGQDTRSAQASGSMGIQQDLQEMEKRGVPIEDLIVFPLQHASKETIEKLRRRGRTFWKCRERRFVSYQEIESANLQNSVRGAQYSICFLRVLEANSQHRPRNVT